MPATPSIARISEALCREHWEALVTFAMLKGNTREDATDAVQELFLALLRKGCYETLGAYAAAQQRAFLRQRLGWLLVNRHRARVSRRLHLQVELDAALDVATDDTPALALDRGFLRAALHEAGVTEDAFLPERGVMTGNERVRLTRRKQRLRGCFAHFES